MKVSEVVQVEILRKLYKVHPDCLFVEKLKKGILGSPSEQEVLGGCIYLQDKGRVAKINDGWKITASGIDFLEEQNLV